MKFFSNLLFSFALTYVSARQVTFKVICMEGSNVSVNVNGGSQTMMSENNLPYYTAVLDVADPISYSYSVDGQAEGFSRTLDSSRSETYNDFFGREITVKEIPKFGYPNKKPWDRSLGPGDLFDTSYIPTLYFTGTGKFFQTAPTGATTFESLTIFLKDSYKTIAGIQAACKNRQQDKFQIRFGIPGGIKKRTILKLRASSEDPTFMRQIVYSDMLHAVGNPTHENVACRVYADGVPIGFYVLQEDTTTLSFIKSAFYGDESTQSINVPATDIGSPLDCSTGADFQPDNEYSSFQPMEGKSNELIGRLTEEMSQLDINNKDAIKEFSEKWFDLDVFFRAIAFEYLAGHWDSYWYYTTNFVMYNAPEESSASNIKYYFIDQDFDLTWGCGLSDVINRYGNEFPSKSYNEDVNREWNISDLDGATRYAIDKFLAGGLTKGMFEAHLVNIVTHVFNPVSLGEKVYAYRDRYRPEMVWDLGLTRQYNSANPNKYQFTIEDFDTNIETGGRQHAWGIMDWTKMRADAVAKEFNFEYDKVPLSPESASNMDVNEIEPVASGSDLSSFTGGSVSGTTSRATFSILSLLVSFMMAVLLL